MSPTVYWSSTDSSQRSRAEIRSSRNSSTDGGCDAQRSLLLFVEAKLGQELAGVLSRERRRTGDVPRSSVEARAGSRLHHTVDANKRLADTMVRMIGSFTHGQHRGDTSIAPGKYGFPLEAGSLPDSRSAVTA